LGAIALGGFIGWLAPDAPMPESTAVAWLLATGLLIALRERINPFAATAGLIVMAAVQGYAHGAIGRGLADPAGFALGAMLASALLMFIGASLGGALRVDRAVQAGGLALVACGVLFLIA
jgi:hydrogenase/urease accessory protein HupE